MFARHLEEVVDGGKPKSRLVSATLVEQLFAANPERAALGIVLSMYNGKWSDIWRVLHGYDNMIRAQGEHVLDCTSNTVHCGRCRAEIFCEMAAAFERMAGAHHVDPLALALATEQEDALGGWLWDYTDDHHAEAEVATCFEYWTTLSDDQRRVGAERAARYRSWVVDKKLPPYPDDWPAHWAKFEH